MSSREVSLRIQKKVYQSRDKKGPPEFPKLSLEPQSGFPGLPTKSEAPASLLESLRKHVDEILAGQWRAFGHLPLEVNDPPKWQFDYLVGRDFQSDRSAFQLDHRAQPGGADIKVIWEPSRWYQLVRLAMAAWLLEHERAQAKCLEWLADWCRTNQPFTGLNWTSGLETGIRLVQFAWIDALLCAAGAPAKQLSELRQQILLPHTWYTWRYRSFGSSANNHLLGELAGLTLAITRWPELAQITAPLEVIGADFEHEVLAQFAEDGGNNEQALGYHLFSFEFCWQSMRALQSAGIKVDPRVENRLARAGSFYELVKPPGDPWDFGDSDNAYVTPLFAEETEACAEWGNWFRGSSDSLGYWWGRFPGQVRQSSGEWELFENSGYAIFRNEEWFVRLDASNFGYLAMAPHGHLDALHVSIWFRGEPIVIDPGTGAYYADKSVRDYLAGWSAHNGPALKSPREPFPKRRGTFLWSSHHQPPTLERASGKSVEAAVCLPYGKAERRVTFLPEKNAVVIEDLFVSTESGGSIITKWKFAPHLRLEQKSMREVVIQGGSSPLRLEASGWTSARLWNVPEPLREKMASTYQPLSTAPLEAIVSPGFRSLAVAPYFHLEAPDDAGFLQLVLSPA